MSAPALTERSQRLTAPPGEIGRTDADRRSSERSGGGGLTLEQRLDGVWEDLRADGAADCPVCEASMSLSAEGHAVCGGCGSRLV